MAGSTFVFGTPVEIQQRRSSILRGSGAFENP